MKNTLFIFFFLLFPFLVNAQEKYTLSGNVKDAVDGEDLIGVTILVKELPGTGTTANVYGFYSITLPKGEYTIQYTFIGYKTQEFKLNFNQNLKKNIELSTDAAELEEFEVTATRDDENIGSTDIGVTKVDMREIESIPVLFGERDVMKTLQLMPGVKSSGEGGAGFFVRGGGADQNLILLDGAPVYNASHLLGFFSVFNSDAIKDLKLYKGGIPAEYGGRLSSVMDIVMKDGNSKKMEVSGGLGLISSKLTVEGPIIKDKGSFIVSGRRTYADVFLKFSSNKTQRDASLYFYDLNMKANYRFSEKDRVFLSGYFGRDNLGYGDAFGFNWGNATGTLRWNHLFSDKLFSNTSFIYSQYNYKIEIGEAGFKIASKIKDITLKEDLDYFLNDKNKLKLGGAIVYHTFDPGEVSSTEEDGVFNNTKIENRYSFESALYISNEQKLASLLTVTYGLRYSNFTQIGPGEIYTYDQDGKVSDSTDYKSWESVVSYSAIEPRFALNYILNELSSIKASYSRSNQYLHLLSNSSSGSPIDAWMPSSNNIKPEVADQVSLGYFKNLKNNTYEFSVETYYKILQNAIDYRTGAEVTLNATVEGELLYGEGRAYGLEFFLKKKKGDFTGWLSYTLARTEKKFEEVNKNTWYPAKQDRTHDVSLVLMYALGERIKLSSSFVFYTGSAVTFPTGKYVVDNQTINLYSDRNASRMPNYHRMDIGMTLENKKFKEQINAETGEMEKIKKKVESSWNFSVYNLYGRENAYSIDFRENEDDPTKTEIIQLSLFKIIPSISYNFRF
ncbi:MAG: carboxypeptidase-like regulatory domain-containing protein [Vicingus serpentipes]|nr:carboxypeptidase-like regulatory domain-containing protein [Vicingus serpentipes]